MSVQVKLIDTPRCPVSDANALMPSCDTGTFVVVFG